MKKYIAIILLICSSTLLAAQNECLLEQPAPMHLVVDQANIFTDAQENELEQELIRFNNETSNQILIVTVNDLCGYDKAEFTYSLGKKWGVGQQDFNNGVVVMVKPHGQAGDRHVFIATGYGLEGAIPDAIAKRIVEVEMIPEFKNGNFYMGVAKAVNTIEGLAKGEIDVKKYGQQNTDIPVVPLLIILAIIAFVFYNAVRRIQKGAVGRDLSFWTALWMLNSMTRHNRGHWGNFRSGGGSFGGFGGGSFGGGGAGGSW